MSLPQEIPLTDEELHQLLGERRLARLATIDKEGWPQVTPVWFKYRNGVVEVVSEKKSFKVRNMLRNRRVALVVEEDASPNRSVMIKGFADVVEKDVGEAILRQSVKYLGDENGRVYAGSLHSQDFVLVRIRPVKTKTWSYR